MFEAAQWQPWRATLRLSRQSEYELATEHYKAAHEDMDRVIFKQAPGGHHHQKHRIYLLRKESTPRPSWRETCGGKRVAGNVWR